MTALHERATTATATGRTPGTGPEAAELLAGLAEHLAGELRLRPLLERVLRAALELLGCADGAVSLLEDGGRTYRKEVEVGVVCDAGRSFPVDEGLTGLVLRGEATVIVEDYADVPAGHLHAVDRARLHAAVGVPVLHGPAGAVLGALVVFSADPARRFTAGDAELLALFARHAAVALSAARLHAALSERERATAAARDREAAAARAAERTGRHLAEVVDHLAHGRPGPAEAAARCALAASRQASSSPVTGWGAGSGPVAPAAVEAALRAEAAWAHRTLALPVRVVVAGPARTVGRDVADHLVLAVRSAVLRLGTGARAGALRVGLVHGDDGVALLVEDDGGASDQPDPELLELVAATERLGGSGAVTTTPGWGTHLRLHLPRSRQTGEAAAPAAPTTGVLVVDGRPAVRAGLAALLAQPGSGTRVVAQVAGAAELAGAAGAARPHVVLVGAAREGGAGAAVEALHRAHPGMPVVLLAGLPDDVGAAELSAALQRAARGAAGADPARSGPEVAPAGATPREREVLALLERGWSDRQIADELVITRKTVEKHVGSLLRKHGVHSRTALVAARLH
ncbi:GAF domain-containing protein [Quadrisphaera sp. KR29]|uniref:GAF domain-containing protein n=1 Tax=Quadrisphaera sp. KR29 TaxID=3461391 RepID=UPI0040445DA6